MHRVGQPQLSPEEIRRVSQTQRSEPLKFSSPGNVENKLEVACEQLTLNWDQREGVKEMGQEYAQ